MRTAGEGKGWGPRHGVRAPAVALAGALVVSVLAAGRPSGAAEVAAVVASAYGYFTNVSLFGGPAEPRGPAPTVALPAEGGERSEADPDGAIAKYGPADIFQSGPIDVAAQGRRGGDGSSIAAAHLVGYQDPDENPPDPDGDGPGPFLFQDIRATCRAGGSGATGTVEIKGGIVETRYDKDTQRPVETVDVPTRPPAGHTVEGTLDHVGDRFRVVFNEQVRNPDGSLTVSAAHVYLLGPLAVGDAILGQTVCGVTVRGTATAAVPTTIAPPPPATAVPTTTTAADATGTTTGTAAGPPTSSGPPEGGRQNRGGQEDAAGDRDAGVSASGGPAALILGAGALGILTLGAVLARRGRRRTTGE